MAFEGDGALRTCIGRLQCLDPSISIAKINPFFEEVVANVIRILKGLEGFHEFKRCGIEHLHRSVSPARHKKPVQLGNVKDSLRFMETSKTPNPLPFF